jgi:hypothetical protein
VLQYFKTHHYLAALVSEGGDGTHVSKYLISCGCKYLGVDVSMQAVSACQERGVDAQVIELERPLPTAEI